MAELVKQDAREQQNDEQDALPGRVPSTDSVMHKPNPGQQQQKGDVDLDFRTGDSGDPD
jgi:hypothetical protein